MSRIRDGLKNFLSRLFPSRNREDASLYFPRSEKVVVFVVAYIIAVSLWLLVNLGREYNLSVQVPVEIQHNNEELALVEEPPDYVTVSISGEGWQLLNFYNNPPPLQLHAQSGPVSLEDHMKDNMTAHPEITIESVQPNTIHLQLEERVEKTLPVRSQVELQFENRYGLVDTPSLTPDSVTVYGARSRIEALDYWPTEQRRMDNLREPVDEHIPLAPSPDILHIDTQQVRFQAQVSEFTEGEIRTYVRSRGMPDDLEVRYSPSVVTVVYDVSIEQYAQAQEMVPYEVYVPYTLIEADTTGTVIPEIEPVSDDLNLQLKSMQPRSVDYYIVVRETD